MTKADLRRVRRPREWYTDRDLCFWTEYLLGVGAFEKGHLPDNSDKAL